MSKSEEPITGECFCGDVKYELRGELMDARSCHCSRCRKAFSGQASAMAVVNPQEFNWTAGETLLKSYVGEHGFGLQFCSQCGSTISTVYKDQIYGVTLGCLNGDPDIPIARHIYVGSKASWEVVPEGVVKFNEAPD